jgi:polyhydroxybutyrate depolymerase
VFAAFAPIAAVSRDLKGASPVPVFHVAGEKDPLVPFSSQQRVMNAVRSLNRCEADPGEWAAGCRIYASKQNAPLVAMIHSGGHEVPRDAPELIVRFFKEHTLSNDGPPAKPAP